MTHPKKIYACVNDSRKLPMNGYKNVNLSSNQQEDDDVIYLLEDSVNEMLKEKDNRINELLELVKLAQDELYLIWSDYVDKPHANYKSYFLFKANEVLNCNKKD
jgi:hypothetical protein